MRKLLYAFLSILLAFTACSEEMDMENQALPSDLKKSGDHFYGVKYPEGDMETKGVAQRKKLWYPGSEITIKFLGNPSSVFQEKVKTYAAEWEEYADIKFRFVTDQNEETDVRIGFEWDSRYVTWSYTGTDCLRIGNQNEATVNFADWDYLSEEEMKGDVLRVFGQILGLELEHRHLESGITWRRDMETYWANQLEDIAWNDLKKYVFDPLAASAVIATEEYDENSIMVWEFPRNHTNGISNYPNFELSEKDIEFIGTLYPKPEPQIIATFDITGKEAAILITSQKNITIDWGNGNIQKFDAGHLTLCYQVYSQKGEYIIKIYGDTDAISTISFESDIAASDFNITNCTELEKLYLYIDEVPSKKLTNKKLKKLNIHGDRHKNYSIEKIDLSECTELEYISLSNCNGLSELNIKNCSKIEELDLHMCKLTELDITAAVNLKILNLYNNRLTSLDLSNNHCII